MLQIDRRSNRLDRTGVRERERRGRRPLSLCIMGVALGFVFGDLVFRGWCRWCRHQVVQRGRSRCFYHYEGSLIQMVKEGMVAGYRELKELRHRVER